MQRFDILKLLREHLPQPLVEATWVGLKLNEKANCLTSLATTHDKRDICITAEDILSLIENHSATIRTLPAYTVAWLVYLYRQTDHFEQLQTRMMRSNEPLNPLEWRIYTYAAEANELRALSQERLEELRTLSAARNIKDKLREDLTIAYSHISLLINHNPHLLERLIDIVHDLRFAKEYRRYNLCGINLSGSFAWKKLSYIDFTGATFPHNSCFSTNLKYCNLQNARLLGSCLTHANLKGVNLCDADFTNAETAEMNWPFARPHADITVLGIQPLPKPLNKDDLIMRLNQFYERFVRDRLSALDTIRWAIAIELINTVNEDDITSDNKKLEMLNEFYDHPLFASIQRTPSFMNRIGMGGFFGRQQQANINHLQLAISAAMTEVRERLASPRQNLFT